MSDASVSYRRLPGRGRRGFALVSAARSSLWLGGDHLLAVRRAWVTEEYKRFYFRDIQEISVEENRTAVLWNYIYGMIAAAIALIFWAILRNAGPPSDNLAAWISGGALTGIFLIMLILNLAHGPSCVCRLRTAVQTEELPSLNRVRAAQRAIGLLKPLIEEAQGALNPADMEAKAVREQTPAGVIPPRPAMPSAPLPVNDSVRSSASRIHLWLYLAMALDAVLGLLTHLHPRWHLYFLCSALLLLVVTALSFTALVRQRKASYSEGLKGLTAMAFSWNLLVLFVLFIYGSIARAVYAVRHPGRFPLQVDFYGQPGFKNLSLGADTLELIIGVAGLILAVAHISARARLEGAEAEAPTEPPA